MPLMTAKSIRKSYRRNHVLRGVNLSVEPGTLVGIVGENGSGKSTLLKILAGELGADGGQLQLNGNLGYCPQQPIVNESLTVAEHLTYFKAAYHLKDTDYAKHLLTELNYKKFLKTPAGQLSGGTRQKLNLTLALINQPDLLLLDEPYQGFDWETYLHFWQLVKELRAGGKAVVIISHLLFERGKFDQVMQLENGKLVESTK